MVAHRLSEVDNFEILLIEAGDDPPYSTEIVHLSPVTFIPEIDWGYKTEYDGRTCLGYKDERCTWPRGKVLGGSSTTNSMLYVRGRPYDYDRWANLTGDPVWRYENVLRYFKKSEDFQSKENYSNSTLHYHGIGGLQSVGDLFTDNEYCRRKQDAIFGGFKELGYPINEDESDPGTFLGVSKLRGTVRDGKRCSTAKAFVLSAKHRRNLKVTRRTLACRLLTVKHTTRGVEVSNRSGQRLKVYARREVIVSGGAINSAQLLLLSGIGPRDHLDEMGIPIVKDLPVGYNLHDHVNYLGFIVGFDTRTPNTRLSFTDAVYQFLSRSTGVLTGTDLNSMSLFADVLEDNDGPSSTAHITMTDYRFNNTLKLNQTIGSYKREIRDSYVRHVRQSDVVQFTPTGSLIFSKGRILLNGVNPKSPPRIMPNYFADVRDRELLLGAIDLLVRFVKTEPMKNAGARILRLDIPGCNGKTYLTREYWNCTLDYVIGTSYHPVGSVKMGSKDDLTAVLDSRLRVKGIKRLRVVDASIMPEIVSGNTNAPAIMIGEIGSDFIKEDNVK